MKQYPRQFSQQQLRGAATTAARLRDWPELARIADNWAAIDPSCVEAWQHLSRAWFEQSCFAEAITAFNQVLQLEPDNHSHHISTARLAMAAQDYALARHHLSIAESAQPQSGEVCYALSRLHYLTGELELSEHYCLQTIKTRPDFPPAYVNLGMLREGNLEDDHVQTIIRLFNDTRVHPEYRTMLGFTLGDALDRREQTQAAFDAWQQANEVNRAISEQEGFKYQPEQQETELQLLKEIFATPITSDWLAERNPDRALPIFVLGMPRSGSTLVESVLASHSDVSGGGELPGLQIIYEEIMQTARQQGTAVARHLISTRAGAWREQYLHALPDGQSARWVVDKQPLNFRLIGLIRILFPESPVIYTQRDAVETGFSIWRHKFAKNWPCAHRLPDIGHFLALHAATMDMWQQQSEQLIHIVKHEDMVQQPETVIKNLLKHCSLQEQSDCFSPHKSKRAVATFSAVQVKKPISAKYLDRSSRYANNLVELNQALRDVPTQHSHFNKQKWGIK
ncbi:tetratricopeptide repeat-containing sulfotransferase family protein [Pseudohongiella spirulinae]|uniref:Uncharacterized protein n=1 Tax=Pseudohongiella spirulinae TaxID=1249552 RepID=A0A0S2KDH4_9GAMM|nr:sulfotransferase [Pseudohongiella spirulinae]ALO46369.1 hypothetical protein PS2015_1718 [Pseudohongiella spirulinae]